MGRLYSETYTKKSFSNSCSSIRCWKKYTFYLQYRLHLILYHTALLNNVSVYVYGILGKIVRENQFLFHRVTKLFILLNQCLHSLVWMGINLIYNVATSCPFLSSYLVVFYPLDFSVVTKEVPGSSYVEHWTINKPKPIFLISNFWVCRWSARCNCAIDFMASPQFYMDILVSHCLLMTQFNLALTG